MKLKLKATIKKVANIEDEENDNNSQKVVDWDDYVPDNEEFLAVFYTMDDDKEFKSASEAYKYYQNKDNWPKGWDDHIEEDYINGGSPLKEVKLIDHHHPNAQGYEVTIRIVKNPIEDWDRAESDIYKIETYIPKD